MSGLNEATSRDVDNIRNHHQSFKKSKIMRKHHLSHFRHLGGILAAVCFLLATINSSSAAIINYGDFVGTNVKYTSVSETPNSILTPPGGASDDPLFGSPTILGDALDFKPFFSLFGSDGQIGLQDSKLQFEITSLNDFTGIDSLTISEGGGYAVAGGSPDTYAQQSLIFPLGQIIITAIDGVSVTPIAVPANIQYTFTPMVAPFITTSADTITIDSSAGLKQGGWNAVATFDVAGALAAAGKTGNATELRVVLDNILSVQTEAGTFALIDKKSFQIVTTVPEPTGVALALLGGLGLVAASYRRMKKADC